MGATSSVSAIRGRPLVRVPVSEASRTVAMAWRPSSRMSCLDRPNNPNMTATLRPPATGGNVIPVSGRVSADQPPATAGRIVTSEPSATSVSSPSPKRMSSPLT
jgi:hypothetical protein